MDAKFLFCVAFTFLFSHVNCLSGAFYADNGREQSILYRPLASKDKQDLSKEMLSILGLQKRPKPRLHHRNNSAPLFIMDLYKELENLESGTAVKKNAKKRNGLRTLSESDVIISFVNRIHHKKGAAPNLRHEKDRRFFFDISEVPPDEVVFAAELRIFRDPSMIDENWKHVYILDLYAVHMEGKNLLEPVDEIIISGVDKGWLVFNVTSQFLNWMAFPSKNNGLYLKIKAVGSSHSFDPHELGLIGSRGAEDKQPFLVAYFKTPEYLIRKPRATKKRHHDNHYDKKSAWNPYSNTYASRRSCQRWTLYVSFKDLGWEEWIIAPDGYGAFYCAGECAFPLNAHLNATNHAIIQTLVHLMSPSMVPKPCCAPTQLSAITVLYFDDSSNVILRKYRNMVVTGCGCH